MNIRQKQSIHLSSSIDTKLVLDLFVQTTIDKRFSNKYIRVIDTTKSIDKSTNKVQIIGTPYKYHNKFSDLRPFFILY